MNKLPIIAPYIYDARHHAHHYILSTIPYLVIMFQSVK